MTKFKYIKVAVFQAHGGPAKARMGGDGYEMTPTRPGRYVISTIDWFNSPRYRDGSGIRWGSPMRVQKNIVQVEVDGKWTNLSKAIPGSFWSKYDSNQAVVTNSVENLYKSLYGISKVPDRWVFNDFGHTTIQYFRDINHNYQKDPGENNVGDMIHTTPGDEAATAQHRFFSLTESHGCIHVKPDDIDTIKNTGYAKKGQVVEVHPYSEIKYPISFDRKFGREPYELHFFPGCGLLASGTSLDGFNMGAIVIYAIHKL